MKLGRSLKQFILAHTLIIRNIVNDPGLVFDDIVENEHILKRAEDISHFYDDLIQLTNGYHRYGEGNHVIGGEKVNVSLHNLKKKLYLCLMSVNALEAIRFTSVLPVLLPLPSVN